MHPIPDTELPRRQAVWQALAALYLDTELQEGDIEVLVKTMRNSGYNLQEIKDIDVYEVFPVLQNNLFSPAGAWAGFDPEWLNAQFIRQYRRRGGFFHDLYCRLWNALWFGMRKKEWEAITTHWNEGS